jgi:hypothetical protein
VFKDEVLEEFMNRAEELEAIAVPQAEIEQPKPKKQSMQVTADLASKTNPHRFYTNTSFKQFMGLTCKTRASPSKRSV